MRLMSSSSLIASSIGSTTSRSMSSGSAPGYTATTVGTGAWNSGSSERGMFSERVHAHRDQQAEQHQRELPALDAEFPDAHRAALSRRRRPRAPARPSVSQAAPSVITCSPGARPATTTTRSPTIGPDRHLPAARDACGRRRARRPCRRAVRLDDGRDRHDGLRRAAGLAAERERDLGDQSAREAGAAGCDLDLDLEGARVAGRRSSRRASRAPRTRARETRRTLTMRRVADVRRARRRGPRARRARPSPASVAPSTSTGWPPCTSSLALARRCSTTPSAGASMRAKRALNCAACRFERATL